MKLRDNVGVSVAAIFFIYTMFIPLSLAANFEHVGFMCFEAFVVLLAFAIFGCFICTAEARAKAIPLTCGGVLIAISTVTIALSAFL